MGRKKRVEVLETVWKTGERRQWTALRRREKADVAVVGGGLTGMSIGLWLARAGLSVAIAEAETIGYGASGRCAGILSPRISVSYGKMAAEHGAGAAEAYAHTHLKAIQAICECGTKGNMRFQLQQLQGVIFARNDEEERLLVHEAEAMKRAGISAEIEKGDHVLDTGKNILRFGHTYVLDPVRYLQQFSLLAEALGVRIFEHSRVVAVESDIVYTETGSIQAPYIVIATGYPIVNTPGWYFLRMEQRNICLNQLADCLSPSDVFFSADGCCVVRPFGQGTLVQTTEHPVGSDKPFAAEGSVRKKWKEIFGSEMAGECCTAVETYTPDGIPYIGPYSPRTPNLFVAAGYGGDGMAGSMIAAQAISARILGLPSDGYDLYSPHRKTKNAGVTIGLGKRYLKGLIGGTETPRCSHMGCRLVFNPSSRLWECPCHGSRFDGIGRVVNAPAVRPAQLRGRK